MKLSWKIQQAMLIITLILLWMVFLRQLALQIDYLTIVDMAVFTFFLCYLLRIIMIQRKFLRTAKQPIAFPVLFHNASLVLLGFTGVTLLISLCTFSLISHSVFVILAFTYMIVSGDYQYGIVDEEAICIGAHVLRYEEITEAQLEEHSYYTKLLLYTQTKECRMAISKHQQAALNKALQAHLEVKT